MTPEFRRDDQGAEHETRSSATAAMQTKLFPTTLVGSYPQPDWLIDRPMLTANTPPRVRMRQLWRVAAESLEQAQDHARMLAIRDQARAGIEIGADGEVQHGDYVHRVATAL